MRSWFCLSLLIVALCCAEVTAEIKTTRVLSGSVVTSKHEVLEGGLKACRSVLASDAKRVKLRVHSGFPIVAIDRTVARLSRD